MLGKRSYWFYYIIFEFSIFQCFYFPILNKLMNTDENGKKPMRMKIKDNATRDCIDILMYSSSFTHFQV